MSLKLYRRTPEGLEPSAVEQTNWRARLRSDRWRAAELRNTEAAPIRAPAAALFLAALAGGTFIVLVLGYGTGFWGP